MYIVNSHIFFLKKKNYYIIMLDHFVKTWFTAKTTQGKKVFSEGALCPTVEITIQDYNKSGPNTSRRSTYFGSGTDIPSNLFDFLNRNENFDSEQKLHIPMEDQSESAMIFKQDTIENSVSIPFPFFILKSYIYLTPLFF